VLFTSYAFVVLLTLSVVMRAVCATHGWWRANRLMLAVASVVFYGWAVPAHLAILGYVALVGHFGPRLVAGTAPHTVVRRTVLAVVLVAALGPLVAYKYADYLMAHATLLGAQVGLSLVPPRLGLLLPLGISFFTFEIVSLVLDVHRGLACPAKRPSDVLLFVGFFPHLVAGPIVRAGEFLYQLERRRQPRLRIMAEGGYLLVRGFFLKCVIADNLGALVDRHWATASQPGANASLAMLAMVGFALQIYCDFEGYTTIARGAAYLLGFRLPINFNGPYIATTFQDFWRRWHITLSRWLRDYLYVSLGGNRGSRFALYRNLMITMTMGGLWHGAADTFLVWGGLHGLGLVVERALGLHEHHPARLRMVRRVWPVVVQASVLVAWVFFRSVTMDGAWTMLGNVFGGTYAPLTSLELPPFIWLTVLAPLGDHGYVLARERWGIGAPPAVVRGCWAACMLYLLASAYGKSTQFIYFRF
jgi:alginate O-acetyltransferase complex protein AlgI